MAYISSFCPHSCDKIPGRSSLREEGWLVLVTQESEAAGGTASVVRSHSRTSAGAQLAFLSLFSLGPQSVRVVPPTFRVGLLIPVNPS